VRENFTLSESDKDENESKSSFRTDESEDDSLNVLINQNNLLISDKKLRQNPND